jgi:hypothetical protein
LGELYKHRDREAAKLGISMKSKKGDVGAFKRPAAVAREDDDDEPLVPPKQAKKVVLRKPAASSLDGESVESEKSESNSSEDDLNFKINLGDPPALGFFEEAQLLS